MDGLHFTVSIIRYEVRWEDGAMGFLPCTAGIFRHAPPNPRTLTKPVHTTTRNAVEAGTMKGDENSTLVQLERAVGSIKRVEAGHESPMPLGECTNQQRCTCFAQCWGSCTKFWFWFLPRKGHEFEQVLTLTCRE